MYTDKISILLVVNAPLERQYLQNIFKTVTVPHALSICENSHQLDQYLRQAKNVPHLILLSADIPGMGNPCHVKKIRQSIKLQSCTLGMYSRETSDNEIRELFASGLNIYIEKPEDRTSLDKIIKEVVSVNWQYITDGLDRERFIMRY